MTYVIDNDPDNLNEEVEDFDAWLEEEQNKRGPGKRVKIYGVVVTLPTDMPLGLSMTLEQTADSTSLKDIQRIVGALYGQDALDHWAEAGMGQRGFQVLLAYGLVHANGKNITLTEAARLVDEADKTSGGGSAGKARKVTKKRSGR